MSRHTMPEVTEKIIEIMKEKRMRQVELAEKTGMQYRSLHRTLHNRTPLYADELVLICKALDISVNDLMLGKKHQMKNIEKYSDALLRIALNGDCVAIVDGEPFGCMETFCSICEMSIKCCPSTKAAREYLHKWAEQEAKS